MEPNAKAANADPLTKIVLLLQEVLQFLINFVIIAAAMAFVWQNLPPRVSTL